MSTHSSTKPSPNSFKLIAATFTPMRPSGELWLEQIPAYYRHLRQSGVDGIFVCGTTGEGAALTVDERRQVLTAWTEARGAERDFQIFIHVGHESLSESRKLAAHAVEIGADAISSISPASSTADPLEDSLAHAAKIAESAPELPYYFYYMPSRSGVLLPLTKFLAAAVDRIPNFAGVKFTHHDIGELAECQAMLPPGVEMLYGRDELLLPALSVGATGAIGSTYNFAAPIYRNVISAFEEHNLRLAREHLLLARQMIHALVARHPLSGQKACMSLLALDCGPVRPPLVDLTPEELFEMTEALTKLNFRPLQLG